MSMQTTISDKKMALLKKQSLNRKDPVMYF